MSDSPYLINDEYYEDIRNLTDDFISHAHSYFNDDVEILEGLIVSVYLKTFYPKSFEEIIDYLDFIGDYDDQIPFLRNWINADFSKYEVLSNWFFENCSKYISQYTSTLNRYMKKYSHKPKSKEESIFFNSSVELYYLNMLSAEIMGRIYRPDYLSRKRKAIVLPTCMKFSQEKCQATKERLGEVCQNCNPSCEVSKISKANDCELYLVSHKSSAFKGATVEDKNELGIIGIACPLNLISGGLKALNLGIPPQCVLLEKVACSRHWLNEDIPSSISKKELERIIS